jgi:hypothetical protein
MNSTQVAKLLGAAQLAVILGNLIMDNLLTPVVAGNSISDVLVNISHNIPRVRISNLVALVQTLAIIILGEFYYLLFTKQSQPAALIALGCFALAAFALLISKIGMSALIPISQDYPGTGLPEAGNFQVLGKFLYFGIEKRGIEIHMLFLALGFLLTNYLFYTSRMIPRTISIWGLVAISLLLIPTVLTLYDREFLPGTVMLALPYAPY